MRKLLRCLTFFVWVCCLSLGPGTWAQAETNTNEPVRGPFISGAVRGPESNEVITMRGIVAVLGEKNDAFMCYDTDLMRVSLAWRGEFLGFGNTLTQIAWPPPQVKGDPQFTTKALPGWGDKQGGFADPRTDQDGPLPKGWAHYKGLYVNGREVVLKYSVGDAVVLECPGFQQSAGYEVFTRTIQFSKTVRNQSINLMAHESPKIEKQGTSLIITDEKAKRKHLLIVDGAVGVEWVTTEGQITLKLGKVTGNRPVRIAIATMKLEDVKGELVWPELGPMRYDIQQLIKGGAATWTESIQAGGVRSEDKEP